MAVTFPGVNRMGMPMVSVCVVTYNHERYLARALESVLMQRVAVPVEVVVGEDCSTDGTRQIAHRYAAAHPSMVRIIERQKNVGGNRNFALALAQCRGKYVALLDGDDYWTSPHKLQRQFELLEKRSECVACLHTVDVVHDETPQHNWVCRPPVVRETYSLAEMLRGYQFQTCSAMLRASAVPPFPDWYFDLKIGDLTLFAMMADRGPIAFTDEAMAAYRVHPGGLWSGQDRVGQQLTKLAAYEALSRHFQGRHDSVLRPLIAEVCSDLASRFETRGDMESACSYARRALAWGAWRLPARRRMLLRMMVRFHCPPVYGASRAVYRRLRSGAAQAGNS